MYIYSYIFVSIGSQLRDIVMPILLLCLELPNTMQIVMDLSFSETWYSKFRVHVTIAIIQQCQIVKSLLLPSYVNVVHRLVLVLNV